MMASTCYNLVPPLALHDRGVFHWGAGRWSGYLIDARGQWAKLSLHNCSYFTDIDSTECKLFRWIDGYRDGGCTTAITTAATARRAVTVSRRIAIGR